MSITRDEFTAEAYMQETEKRLGSTLLTIAFLIVGVFSVLPRQFTKNRPCPAVARLRGFTRMDAVDNARTSPGGV
jgi:hypothetical protein